MRMRSDKREGKPFGEGDRDEDIYVEGVGAAMGVRKIGGVRTAEEAFQPRGISDATVIKPQYIGTDDDEPWHSTCRPQNALTKSDFEKGLSNSLPFVKAEAKLGDALRSSNSSADVKSALEKALAAGGRAGSPAFTDADKLLKAYEKGDDAGVKKAMPKPPKADTKPQGKGWDEYGPGNRNAKTHDNSVA